jgi:exosortase B
MSPSSTISPARRGLGTSAALLLGGAGFLLLLAPVYMQAAQRIWVREEHAHAPLILGLAGWLLFQCRDKILNLPVSRTETVLGALSFVFGLLLYLTGRAAEFSIFEFGAQIPLLAGIIVLLAGLKGIRLMWFPVFFLVFMIPLPTSLVDQLTGPLKAWVSVIAEHVLYAMDYPIARTGVMLTVGQYKLQVADACAGLHSMFTLTAMGMLFMNLKKRASVLHNALMLLAILPIAFVANTLRVLALVLITYHFGDEAGQGFMHGSAGILLIVSALLVLIGFDSLIARILKTGGAA